MKMPVRIAGGVAALLFLAAAVVQLNDPDPWPWFSLYAVGAVFSGILVFKRRAPGGMLALGTAALVWGAMLMPQLIEEQAASADAFFDSELARETCGLALTAILMIALWFASRRKKS